MFFCSSVLKKTCTSVLKDVLVSNKKNGSLLYKKLKHYGYK